MCFHSLSPTFIYTCIKIQKHSFTSAGYAQWDEQVTSDLLLRAAGLCFSVSLHCTYPKTKKKVMQLHLC